MIVCHCKVVRAADIAGAVARGARSVDEVAGLCGATTRCGGCRPLVEALVETPVAIGSAA